MLVAKPRALVIENDHSVVEIARRIAADHGINLDVAVNLAEGRAKVVAA
jgi:hypothetical protein